MTEQGRPDPRSSCARLLIAGVGNIFLGDDAFGVEVVRHLAQRALPANVTVVDFGIRGFDLACALVDGYDGVILVDTAQRGQSPGTLYLIEPEVPGPVSEEASSRQVNAHSLHPVEVLRLAQQLGTPCSWIRVLGCEPASFGSDENPQMGLSEPLEKALSGAVQFLEELIQKFPACPEIARPEGVREC